MNRVLMIAYHFPPLAGSSGIQRTLRFVQHLPDADWQPLVLTVNPRAYERTGDDLERDVPSGTVVHRAFALDAARHLSIGQRYPAALARPDRWKSWRHDGVRQGMKLVRNFRPGVIWSTYPIPTAHVIAAELHRRTGTPWVADFRDPMAQHGYPADPATWSQYKAIEELAVRHSARCVFTTPGALGMYRRRYPDAADRMVLIENGYDEESFEAVEATATAPLHPGAITLLHSGIVYPQERDPTHLFSAVKRLAQSGRVAEGRLKIRFRAAVHDKLLTRLAAEHGIEPFIETCPPLPYKEALAEMLRADALLVLQASNCNEQVPAKIYEYLRARRPILGLTDPAGDTAHVLRQAGVRAIVPLDGADEIATSLLGFLTSVGTGRAELPDADAVRRASRRERARALAEQLARVALLASQVVTSEPASFHGAP